MNLLDKILETILDEADKNRGQTFDELLDHAVTQCHSSHIDLSALTHLNDHSFDGVFGEGAYERYANLVEFHADRNLDDDE